MMNRMRPRPPMGVQNLEDIRAMQAAEKECAALRAQVAAPSKTQPITLNHCQECRYFRTRRNKTMHATRTINEGYCNHYAFEYAGQGAMGVDGDDDIPIPPWCPLRENPQPKPPDW